MPETTSATSNAGMPGGPQGAGKGGGGALPQSSYPFVPQWMQERQAASRKITPALNPGQGAGRFMGSRPPASPPPASGSLMGGSTPTSAPVVATQAAATLRPSVTPSIYEQWKGYNAAAKQTMLDNPPPMTTAEAIDAFKNGKITRQTFEEALASARGEAPREAGGG